MIKQILTSVICLLSFFCFAQDKSIKSINIIDVHDSVVYDLFNAVEAGGFVEFPVKFLSGDVINAVDFSFNYDTLSFAYDTTIRLAPYMSITANETSNRTVFFTSFSSQQITNDTPLVKVRFQILSGHFCSGSMNTVMSYLNGDACSNKITDCLFLGMPQNNRNENALTIFPSPVNTYATISFTSLPMQKSTLQIFDARGRLITEEKVTGSPHVLYTDSFENGIYWCKVLNEFQVTEVISKIVVMH